MFVEGGIQGGVPDCRDWIQDMILINYASQGEIAELSMGSPYGKKEVFLTSFIQYVFVIFIICKQRTFLNNLRMTKIWMQSAAPRPRPAPTERETATLILTASEACPHSS